MTSAHVVSLPAPSLCYGARSMSKRPDDGVETLIETAEEERPLGSNPPTALTRELADSIEPDDAVVFHEYARHAIARGGNKKRQIESELVRSRLQLAVEIRLGCAEPEMPFAHQPGVVARLLEHRCHGGHAGRNEQRRVARRNARPRLPPRIFPREERKSRRGANRRWSVRVSEAYPFARDAVEVRRLHALRAIATQIAIADVVGQDENYVGLRRHSCRARVKDRERKGDAVEEEGANHGE